MNFSLPEIPDEPEEIDYPSGGQNQSSGQESDQDSSQGQNPLDQASDLKDKFDTGKSLKDKLAGGSEGASEAAAGEGAGAATGSGGAAAEGATAGTGGATAASGGAAGTSAAGTVGAATGTGAAGAVGTAGAAGVSTGTGVAAGAATATGGTTLGAGLSSTGVGALAGVPIIVGSLATSKTGRRILIPILIGCFGLFLISFAIPLLTLLIFFIPILGGGGSSEAAGVGGNSQNLVVSKKASVTKIPKGTPNAQVVYTITVTNHTTKEAINVTVTDTFTSSPQANFATEISGYEGSFTIVSIPAGQSVEKTFTITIPHTDFDPGWILFNSVKSSGTIEGSTEDSSSGVTVIIGNPPTGPPAFSPLRNPRISGYVFDQQAQGSNGIYSHQGVDLANDDLNILSPFAQPAVVITNDKEGNGKNDGFGNYVVLESGEWRALLAHLKSQSNLTEGQSIDSSTLIGIMGESGFANGVHLHYEVHQNGTPVNPELYNALVSHP